MKIKKLYHVKNKILRAKKKINNFDNGLKNILLNKGYNISKITTWTFIIFFSLLNITLRYKYLYLKTFDGHQGEYSSYLIDMGYAPWLIHILSFFGRYPGSVPSGDIFLNSSFRILSSLELMVSFSSYRIVLSIFALLGTFILSRDIYKNNLFAICTAAIYSLGREFLALTTMNTGFRGTFLALIPLMLWLLVKLVSDAKKDYRLASLFIFLLFTLATIHRMIFLLLIIILSAIIIKYIFPYLQKFFLLFAKRKTSFFIAIILLIVFTIILSPYIIPIQILTPRSLPGLFRTPILRGDELYVLLTNLSAHYSFYLGLPILLVPFGLIYLYSLEINLRQTFLIFGLLSISPLIIDVEYIIMLSLIFLSILSGLGVLCILKLIDTKVNKSKLVVILLVIILLILPSFVTLRAGITNVSEYGFVSTQPFTMEHEIENTGIYLRSIGSDGIYESNDRRVGRRLGTFSKRPYREGLRLLDQINQNEIKIIDLDISFFTQRHWFDVRDPIWTDRYRPLRYTLHGHNIRNNHLNDSLVQELMVVGNIRYYTINQGRWEKKNQLVFTVCVIEGRYKVYDNGPYSLYFLQ